MSAFVVVQALEVTDAEGMSRYAQVVGQTIQQHEGRVVAGRQPRVLEGELQPLSMFVIEFPSPEHVQRWYDSEEYREPKELRLRSSRMNLFVVPGI
ncbi:MAG TPA: DUF1330 domain-containing protein [Dehalococcoidia bacterium]|nr:DUF1330 domain-containing protein [Dehalococcoidia bacterium]